MRKFYFLKNDKKWHGPLSLLQVQLLALKGTIHPDTYLWHNKLANDKAEHPENCIYARKTAFEFVFLPRSIFGSNIKIMLKNSYKRIKKKFSKKDSYLEFLKKPIKAGELLDGAKEIFLTPSITAVHDFGKPVNFRVELQYIESGEDILKTAIYPIKLKFDNIIGIKFELTMKEPPNVTGVLHKESYGLDRMLLLKNNIENIIIEPNSVVGFSTRFPYKPQILEGFFTKACIKAPSGYKNIYNRLLLHIDDDKTILPHDILNHTGIQIYDNEKFNVHKSIMGFSIRTGGRFTEVTLEEKKYHLYSVNESLYVIDGIQREDFEDFKHISDTIRIGFAILSGKFYGGVSHYASSDTPEFKSIEGVHYEKGKVSIISKRRLIDLPLFRETFKEEGEVYESTYKAINTVVSEEIFSNLCQQLYSSENIRHAAELVISAMGHNDPVQQGALYSVALEALTEELAAKKTEELKPITDKKLAHNLRDEMIAVLESHEEISPEAMRILKIKVNDYNKPTNQDKLTKTFELYGMKLTNDNIGAIKNRNSFLHGRSPIDRDLQFELTEISLKLHTLIGALLLKSIGYAGHIVNLDIIAVINNPEKMIPILKEQHNVLKRTFDSLEIALKNDDPMALKKSREEFNEIINSKKQLNRISII